MINPHKSELEVVSGGWTAVVVVERGEKKEDGRIESGFRGRVGRAYTNPDIGQQAA
jgi:hypothetical protein